MNAIALHAFVVPAAASGTAGAYVDWWVIHISVTNLVIIGLMVVTFVAALLLPFPGHDEDHDEDRTTAPETGSEGQRSRP
jgi:membrane protein YqaA with SNARE-associated domain